MADPVATVQRENKRYIRAIPTISGNDAARLTGTTQVGDIIITEDDGAVHVCTSVSESGLPTLQTITA